MEKRNSISEMAPAASRPGRRLYYGYIIVALCFLIMTLAYGAQNSFGVFFKPMAAEFGWSRAATSGPFALYMIVSGVLSIIAGRLSDRLGPRVIVTIGGLSLGSGYILMSRTGSLWELYLYYGVLVAAGSSAIYIPLVAMIARWFTRRRGLMSGIGIAGIGFGIGVVPALASWLLERTGWQSPLWIIGVGAGVLIILLAQFLNHRPPDTTHPENSPETDRTSWTSGITFREALKTRTFWMLFFAWICYGYFFQIGVVHVVPYATDLGMSQMAAATILSTIGIIGTAGRISLGFIGDRCGNRTAVLISFVLISLAFAGLAVSQSVAMLYGFAVIFGFLFGFGILLVPLVVEYFGFKDLGLISGIIVFANSIGGAIGPPLAGGIFDASGSYRLAFISCAVMGLAGGLLVWLLKPGE